MQLQRSCREVGRDDAVAEKATQRISFLTRDIEKLKQEHKFKELWREVQDMQSHLDAVRSLARRSQGGSCDVSP